MYVHPDYVPGRESRGDDLNDLAVIVFPDAVNKGSKGIKPATLPTAGSLSDTPHLQLFTSVGYGAYEVVNRPGGKAFLYNDVRMQATGTLNAVTGSFLHISTNSALENGGACYGDSGGPNFLGTSDTLAAITITGDYACRASNDVERADRVKSLEFLAPFLTL